MKKIFLVVGARPNFMKMAPLYFEMKKLDSFEPKIVHTGQHYDYDMSQAFFEDLDLPEPHYFLEVGSGTHAEQTAKIMVEFEKVLFEDRPDLVVVFGDVNSTLACSVAAKKLLIPVCHVEAGLRSFDETMPEEINRIVTDRLADLLLTPSLDGNANLEKEGVPKEKIFFVGNIMIDSLTTILKKIDEKSEQEILDKFNLEKNNYALITLHRPATVDNKEVLEKMLAFLNQLTSKIKVFFPMHPRTKKNIKKFNISADFKFEIAEPVRYREFVFLQKNAKFVLTDSGGVQEETTFLRVPCLTFRPNTERPITITEGKNELVTLDDLENYVEKNLNNNWKDGKIPELWDGETAKRIVEILK